MIWMILFVVATSLFVGIVWSLYQIAFGDWEE